MLQALLILFGAAFTVAVCVSLGRLLFSILKLRFDRAESILFGFVVGSACLSGIVFALAALGLIYPVTFLAIGCAAIAAGRRGARTPPVKALQLPRAWALLLGGAFAAVTVFYFFNAMAPEHSPDGSSHHLGLVARYLREHGFRRITTDMYASLSQGVEMLFLFAFAFGRHSAAALVHFAFLLALPAAMLLYARRFGFGLMGTGAALLVFASPVIGIDGISAYNDVAVACVLFTLFYLLQVWDELGTPALLVPIGLLAGFCYAAKYTAFLALPYAIGFVAWKLWRSRQPLPRALATLGLCAFVMMGPWMAKNYLWVRNPFSPFFNRIFPNPYVRVSFERQYVEILQNFGNLKSRWDAPMELAVRGGLGGIMGPAFLLAPFALLALRQRAGRRLLLAAAVFAVPWFANAGARFLIPCTPFLALAMGLALGRGAPVLALAHAVSVWPPVLGLYCGPYTWRLETAPVRAALRLEPEDQYLQKSLMGYPVARMIENVTPPGAKIFTVGGLPQAYTSRDILVAYQSAFNSTISEVLLTPVYVGTQPRWQVRFSFATASVRKLRVVQTGLRAGQAWSVTEVRVFNPDGELPRDPPWHVISDPSPWDIRYAFDHNPVTRWTTERDLSPGMYIELDFGRTQSANRVVLTAPLDGREFVRLRLEGQAESGAWTNLSENPEQLKQEPPFDLGSAAVGEVKRRGVDYVLVSDSDDGSREFRENGAAWGMALAGEAHGVRLYRLN